MAQLRWELYAAEASTAGWRREFPFRAMCLAAVRPKSPAQARMPHRPLPFSTSARDGECSVVAFCSSGEPLCVRDSVLRDALGEHRRLCDAVCSPEQDICPSVESQVKCVSVSQVPVSPEQTRAWFRGDGADTVGAR